MDNAHGRHQSALVKQAQTMTSRVPVDDSGGVDAFDVDASTLAERSSELLQCVAAADTVVGAAPTTLEGCTVALHSIVRDAHVLIDRLLASSSSPTSASVSSAPPESGLKARIDLTKCATHLSKTVDMLAAGKVVPLQRQQQQQQQRSGDGDVSADGNDSPAPREERIEQAKAREEAVLQLSLIHI